MKLNQKFDTEQQLVEAVSTHFRLPVRIKYADQDKYEVFSPNGYRLFEIEVCFDMNSKWHIVSYNFNPQFVGSTFRS